MLHQSHEDQGLGTEGNTNTIGFAAGVLGGFLIAGGMALLRLVELSDLSFEVMIGSIISGETGTTWFILGLSVELLALGLVGMIYASIFWKTGHGGSWYGALLGIAHWVITGIALGVVSRLHPLLPSHFPNPGLFASNSGGGGAIGLFLLHMAYGAVVGSFYEPDSGQALTVEDESGVPEQEAA